MIDAIPKNFSAIREVNTPLKLLALIIFVISASMFGIATKLGDDMDRTILIVGAIILLFAIVFVVAFNKNFHDKRLLKKMEEGIFEIHDKDNPEIWQGFVDDFKSYNDSWDLEYEAPKKFLKTHKDRYYKDQNCATFHFLFFLKDSTEPFERFVKFQAMVHLGLKEKEIFSKDFDSLLREKLKNIKEIPKGLDKMVVYLNDKIIPQRTFFVGKKKEDQKIVIWYIPMVHIKKSIPELIIKIMDNGFWFVVNSKWQAESHVSEKVLGPDIFEKYLNR